MRFTRTAPAARAAAPRRCWSAGCTKEATRRITFEVQWPIPEDAEVCEAHYLDHFAPYHTGLRVPSTAELRRISEQLVRPDWDSERPDWMPAR